MTTDLAAISLDPLMGPAIVANGTTIYGPLHWGATPTNDGEGNLVLVNERALVVPAAFVTTASITQNTSITIGGVTHKVRDVRPYENDTMKQLIVVPT
jgi:hypothetical protein